MLLRLIALTSMLLATAPPAHAQDKAMAAARPPLGIAVFVSSRTDVCFDPGDVGAIVRMATLEGERINKAGGIAGRQIALRFFDDQRDTRKTTESLRLALADPQNVAMIGLSNSSRAKEAFDTLHKELGASTIPFLSDIAVNSIFERYPTVFTTRASQDEDRLPTMSAFIRSMGISRTAFAGLGDAIASRAVGDGLKRLLGDGRVITDHRFSAKGTSPLDRGEIARLIEELNAKQPELLVLAVGGERAATLLKEMTAAGAAPPLFLTGRIEALPPEVTKAYPNAIYQLAWDRLPEADSDRLRRLIGRDDPESWVFEGRKIDVAPGWAKGECKPRPEEERPNPLASANMRAIGIGAQFADMVALVGAAARTAEQTADIAGVRAAVMKQLATAYAAGRGAFKGNFENWSFHPSARSAMRTPFVVIQPYGLGRMQLAPIQFVRVKDGSLRQIETLYLDIDLVRAHRVEDNEKTFFAEFFLSMRDAKSASIDKIEFTNAYLDPRTGGRQISIETIHGGGRSDAYPETMKIYKVTGRFVFEPELSDYPFDTQRFSIDLQPKRGDAPFIVQPPPASLRDQQVATDGWTPKVQYVGYEEDFVPVIDAFTHAPSVVPFYKASFVWEMRRQATDYYFRVVVPLAFIMIVAYLSIFIPLGSHFEAIVTIQVTALLSAVALYLSLPKLDADAATVSDQIFVFNYMVVSVMIVVTILRINRVVAMVPWLKHALALLHFIGIPLLVAAMAWYVHGLSMAV